MNESGAKEDPMPTKRLAGLLITAMSFPGWGQSQPQGRFALTAGQVAKTLSEKGIQIEDRQVSLLANVVASDPNPVLDVLSVAPIKDQVSGQDADTRSLVKLACHEPGECVPFYAIVNQPKTAAKAAPGKPASASAAGIAEVKPNASITMRAGAHATLVMDDDRSHIQVSVVSLENGMVGHRIRVASPDHKQFYYGEVVSANLLKRSY